MLTVNHLVTSGTFSLDGGTWDVDNNVWVLGDDAECVVIDAPHDADAIRPPSGRAGSPPSCAPTPTTTISMPPPPWPRPPARRSGCTPPTASSGIRPIPTGPRTGTWPTGR